MPSPRIVLHTNISREAEAGIMRVMSRHVVNKMTAANRLIGIGLFILDAQDRGDTILIRRKGLGGELEALRFEF